MLLALRYRLARRQIRPFFVLFTQRSGSQLLASYLNCLPGVVCLQEILHSHQVWGLPGTLRPRPVVVRHIRHSLNVGGAAHAGARIALDHLARRGLTPRELGDEFRTARFIVLYRRRLIDQYLSHVLAAKTDRWALTRRDAAAGAPPAVRIRVDRAAFVRYAGAMGRAYRAVLQDDTVRRRAVLLAYEELVADPQAVVDARLAPFLGVPSRRVHTFYEKQGTRPPAEVVDNFAEVRDLWEDPGFVQRLGIEDPAPASPPGAGDGPAPSPGAP
jgi:LPS sulfotransferase NodH